MLVVLGVCALAGPVAAQPVYKCTVDGKVSYGERPCAHGKTTELAVPPAPSGVDAAEALERDKARLAALQKERAASEAREEREEREQQRTARAAATQRRKCERLRLQHTWAEEDAARAGKATSATAQLKAKRQAQALAVQCPA
jgi:hypothetical protein